MKYLLDFYLSLRGIAEEDALCQLTKEKVRLEFVYDKAYGHRIILTDGVHKLNIDSEKVLGGC